MHVKSTLTGSPILLSGLYTRRGEWETLVYREPNAAHCALHKKGRVGEFTLTGSPMLLSALHKKEGGEDFTLTGSPMLLSALHKKEGGEDFTLQGYNYCCSTQLCLYLR